ncbi:MAG: MBL fold metallo-hydrolase [Syntrophaceae bacterium]|nr:MBL fold metallo-hydrolase [Syntrophaceae bacterium]
MIIKSEGKLAEGLYAIGGPHLPAYLLAGETPVLFDAGMTFMGPTYRKDLQDRLGDAGRLRFVCLTHAHFDHCGSCPYLKRHIPGLRVGAHRLAAETLRKASAIELIRSLSGNCEELYRDQVGSEDISFDSLEVDVILEDGDEMDFGGGLTFRVIATPGHTRDSVCYFIPRLRALITGEAVGVFDRNFTIQPEFLASYRDYVASLEKLLSLDPDLIMMSHYYTLTGEDARGYIARSLEQTRVFRDRIERFLHDSGGDRDAVVRRIHGEDYLSTGANLQEERPYLINLQAKVRVVAEGR